MELDPLDMEQLRRGPYPNPLCSERYGCKRLIARYSSDFTIGEECSPICEVDSTSDVICYVTYPLGFLGMRDVLIAVLSGTYVMLMPGENVRIPLPIVVGPKDSCSITIAGNGTDTVIYRK